MFKSFKTDKGGINSVITRSFLLSGVVILLIALVGAIYIDGRNLQIVRENNIQKTHEVLSDFLIPAISIVDIIEARRVLSLVSDKSEIFGVINGTGDIILSDYQFMDLMKKV